MSDGNQGGDPKEGGMTAEEIKAIQDKKEFLETELKKVIKERDEAKGKLRGISDEEALKKGEYERLISEGKAEIETLKSDLEKARDSETKYNLFVENTKKELIAELSEEHKAIAEKLDFEVLKDYVKLNKTQTNYDKSRSGGISFPVENKNWTDFTTEELNEIETKNKKLFDSLFDKYLKTKK